MTIAHLQNIQMALFGSIGLVFLYRGGKLLRGNRSAFDFPISDDDVLELNRKMGQYYILLGLGLCMNFAFIFLDEPLIYLFGLAFLVLVGSGLLGMITLRPKLNVLKKRYLNRDE